MRKLTLVVSIGLTALSAPVCGQDMGIGFRGIRIEANAGGDRYSSSGTHRNEFGYGASVGADAEISHFVLGVEGSYWRDSRRETNCLNGGAGTFCNSSGSHELGAAVRAGFQFTPQLLLFGKGGWVRDRQRNVFTSTGGTFYVNGQFVPGPPSSASRSYENGYELGGGLEYSLHSHLYADAQYVYSRYRNHTVRNRVMLGLGFRF